MSNQYLVGIDGGTQSTKVSIFDLTGKLICEARRPLKSIVQQGNGIAFHPDDDVWDSIVEASRDAISKFPGKLEDILGLGLCTIRCCRTLLDKDGHLVEPLISWMDTRLAEPYTHDNHDVEYVSTSSGYIAKRLTGETIDSAANQEGQWPLDKIAWDWLEGDKNDFGLERSQLFTLAKPAELHGHVTKSAAKATALPEGLPVYVTANDKAVEALGAGLLNDKAALVSLGTYIAGMQSSDSFKNDGEYFFCNLASRPNRYLLESVGIREGMRIVTWLKTLLQKNEIELELLASQLPVGSDGLITLPNWLAAPSSPQQRGAMLGFRSVHGAGHLFRSALEAIAMTMRINLQNMWDELGRTPTQLTLSGGGSKSALFAQIFADVFDLPIQLLAKPDAAGLGAAICAGVGSGAFSSFDEGVQRMVKIQQTVLPKPSNVRDYASLIGTVYRSLESDLELPLKQLHSFQHTT